MHELLSRAYAVLRDAARQSDGVLTAPAELLDRAGLPRILLEALASAGCVALTDDGSAFRVTDRAPHARSILIALDVPNLSAACAGAGAVLDVLALHVQARTSGTIAFAYAFLDPRAASETLQQEIARGGFDVMSCRALSTLAGDAKGTVDQKLDAVVRRHLEWSMVDTVILGSEDQHFLELVHEIRDRGRTCMTSVVNTGCSLARAADIVISIAPTVESSSSPQWNPEDIIGDLEGISKLPPAEQLTAYRRIELRSPMAARVLRNAFLRRDRMPTRTPAFATLLSHVGYCVSIEDRKYVTDDHLQAFLTALINAGLIEKHKRPDEQRTWYSFDDHHPFFRITAERAIR